MGEDVEPSVIRISSIFAVSESRFVSQSSKLDREVSTTKATKEDEGRDGFLAGTVGLEGDLEGTAGCCGELLLMLLDRCADGTSGF